MPAGATYGALCSYGGTGGVDWVPKGRDKRHIQRQKSNTSRAIRGAAKARLASFYGSVSARTGKGAPGDMGWATYKKIGDEAD